MLYLWQNAHTVVIGRNQNPWRECDVEAVKRDKVYLARRMSGGGAVYHDMGNLNFTFIARDELFDIEKQTDVILLACRLLGINAEKTGRNDLTVEGRKFSGHAYFSTGGCNYHHGTIMMNVVPEDLSKYLNVPDSKLRSKGVESVRSRVTNLVDHINDEKLKDKALPVQIEAMKNSLVVAAEKIYGAEALSVDAPEVPKELIDKYTSEEWRLGSRIPFERDIIHRFEWGEVEVQLSMKGNYIKDVKIYSDSLETEVFSEVEKLLAGCKYDRAEIGSLRVPVGTSAIANEILRLVITSI
ncbi:MAG: lipoate--protein ligase [Mogibacterium sp.]|nr:lipoate--protein ligase [Mogibacterium sp.]